MKSYSKTEKMRSVKIEKNNMYVAGSNPVCRSIMWYLIGKGSIPKSA